MKATALTATTVAMLLYFSFYGRTNVQTATLNISNVKTGYVKVDQVALHTNNNANSSSI